MTGEESISSWQLLVFSPSLAIVESASDKHLLVTQTDYFNEPFTNSACFVV